MEIKNAIDSYDQTLPYSSVLLFFLLSGSFSRVMLSAIDINEDDGIWTDSFVTAGTVDFRDGTSSCVWKEGTIQLTSACRTGTNI